MERALAAVAAARGRASHGWPRCALGLAGLGAAAAKHSCARTPPRLLLAKGADWLALRAGSKPVAPGEAIGIAEGGGFDQVCSDEPG
jgi:hypothetical protein